jgi:S1-C subfamily serine protease
VVDEKAEGSAEPGGDLTGRSSRYAARLRRASPLLVGALAALGGVALIGVLLPGPKPLTQEDVDLAIASALASVTPAPAFSEVVYGTIRPSLVLVRTAGAGAGDGDEEADDPAGGLGSGVVVSEAGDILTSLHVLEGASSIEVVFADGTAAPAQIVASQPESDIAVLRAAPPAGVFPAVMGNPGALRHGSEVYAVGNPFGLAGSMSVGVVSGLDRSFTMPETGQVIHGLIQIDAAVNPGNSGGPLVDRAGRVLAIVTALVNPTEDQVFIGIGLAVPINVAGGAAGLPPY